MDERNAANTESATGSDRSVLTVITGGQSGVDRAAMDVAVIEDLQEEGIRATVDENASLVKLGRPGS